MDGITVYTDGSCMGNGSRKSGCGWACKLIYRGHEKIKSGSDTGKTNNQMEMIAVLMAMRSITDTSIPVTVYSDSRYVIETLNENYKIKKNEKLWASIMKEKKRFKDIKFQWVKGHGDNKHNNDVDRWAAREASKRIKKAFRGEQGMTLNEFIETGINSDRLLVLDSSGNELYRGYAGCLQYQDIDGERKVKKHGISTEVYTKINKKKGLSKWTELGERVQEENTSLYKYSDLEMMIFTKIVLEG